jgi:hypothetical protein
MAARTGPRTSNWIITVAGSRSPRLVAILEHCLPPPWNGKVDSLCPAALRIRTRVARLV